MANAESPPPTYQVYADENAYWVQTRFRLEASVVKLHQRSEEHIATFKKIKEDKDIDESARGILLEEIRSKIRQIDIEILNYREQLQLMNPGLETPGICVAPVPCGAVDRLD